MLLNRDASRLSGLLPFELFPAAVKGAVAGSTALQSPSMASGTTAPPQSSIGKDTTDLLILSPCHRSFLLSCNWSFFTSCLYVGERS